jgi:acyl-CoA synthetase (AMP-forming)/AMP-acid ligase II
LFHQSLDFVKRGRYEGRVIFTSPLPPVALPESPLTPYVLERAKERADETALVDGPSGCRVSYAELDAAVRGQAGGWLKRGLTKGEVVAVMAPNCPEYAITFHAVALAGGVVTTINPTYTPGEVHHQLVDSGATRLVTAPMFVETAKAASNGTKITAGETFVIGESLANVTATPLQEQVPVELDDVVALPYSSGTTGTSKGVRLSHRNLTANIAQTQAAIPTDEDDAFVAVLPFFHIYGMQVLMTLGLRAGATIVTMPRFDLEQFLLLHQEHRLTCAFVAPPMVVALAKHPIVEEYDLSALHTVISGAAPLSADLAEEAARRLGCEVIQGYGMTELSPVSHATPPGQFKPGSVGVAVPATEVQIVDPATGTALGEDEDGEVWIRGPQVMAGYLNNEEATKGTIDGDGWLHTGDIGHVDSHGHLYVVDRLKELIKFKGFQVAPAELEALLLTHPKVADAAVIGLPDDEAGELPAAYVVLKPEVTATAEEIESFVAGRVATYKQVRKVTFVEAIPKSASGKILRRVLRDEAGVAPS